MSSRLLPVSIVEQVARECGYAGIDSEVRWSIPFLGRRFPTQLPGSLNQTLWLPASEDLRRNDLRLASTNPAAPQKRLIVQDKHDNMTSLRHTIKAAIKLRGLVGQAADVAIGIRPTHVKGTSHYLASMDLVRMQAQEWDLGVALDLGHQIDWQWEAEAAVTRLMPSLDLIRIRVPNRTFDSRFREALAVRSLATALDLGFDGTIAVIPALPIWCWRSEHALRAVALDAIHMLDSNSAIAGDTMTSLLLPDRSEKDQPQKRR